MMEKIGSKRMVKLWQILILVLPGCTGNSIYFEITNQEIVSCSGKAVKDIRIENVNEKEYYIFEVVSSYSEDLSRIKFKDMPSIYQITKNGILIPNDEFSLSGNSTFIISNSTDGDAAASEIKIITDISGRVVDASIINCK